MKRRLTKLVVFLLLGAVVNVAVAWGCAMPQHNRGYESRVYSIDEQQWVVRIQQHFGSVRRTYMDQRLVIIDTMDEIIHQAYPQAPVEPVPRSSLYRMMDIGKFQGDEFEQLNGWPLCSLAGHGKIRYMPPSNPNQMLPAIHGSLIFVGGGRPPGSDHYRRGGVLPFRPIWPGFAINTIFYATIITILWVLTLGPFTARRMIRRKRGHCIKCGYDLRGDLSAGCSECGWQRASET